MKLILGENLMNKTLVILAAGIGSRFGTGIKQLTPIDNNNHLIIDYSIHDAIAAGFDSIIFIIRHDIEADFKTGIGDRIEKICKPLGITVSYAYQEISNTPRLPRQRWTGPHKALGHRTCCAFLRRPYQRALRCN